MDAATLAGCMPGLPLDRAAELVAGANEALSLIGAVGPDKAKRAAQFLAQIGHESVSLQYTSEIASGEAYNGRSDLGNTQPGDGPRFKGRSFIQITGRVNYLSFSGWAHSQGLVAAPDYFVQHPEELANDRWAWIGAVWYWLVARSTLNAMADAGDTQGCTWAINGGYNGLDDRTARYNTCLTFGASLAAGALAAFDTEEPDVLIITNKDRNTFSLLLSGAKPTTLKDNLWLAALRVAGVKEVKVPEANYTVLRSWADTV